MKKSYSCRSCGSSNLEIILSLGIMPLSNALVSKEDINKQENEYPLDLVFCPECSLVQITVTVDPKILFSTYYYFSSFSETMLKHSKKLVDKLVKEYNLTEENLVVEIASNDGYLLQYFKPYNIPVLGIEPAENIAKIATEKGIQTLCEFFNSETASKLKAENKSADVIIGNNVLAHIAGLNDFIEGIRILLKDDGIGVFEFPYVRDMIDKNEFDTIYHEHLSYYSLTALDNLFNNHKLIIVDIERTAIHGGSLRIKTMHEQHQDKITQNKKLLLKEEKDLGLRHINFYQNFANQVKQNGIELKNLLTKLKAEGKSIAGYGAAAKGAVLTNYFDIGNEIIDFVADRNPHKQGLFMPGKKIPIVSPDEILEKQPDYLLIFAWNFAKEIIAQQSDYQERGGKFIIPIPNLKVI
ncbi:MAG: methyltransferase domain-containing protein [Candidatus Heimdallarchaeota archaeon]